MKKGSKRITKHIVARSIQLVDSEGRTRIFLDAGGSDGYALIALYGPKGGESVQIAHCPDGWLGIDIHDATGKVGLAFSIASDGSPGLGISDHRKGMRTEIGLSELSGEHEIAIYHKGKLRWTTRSQKGKRKSGT